MVAVFKTPPVRCAAGPMGRREVVGGHARQLVVVKTSLRQLKIAKIQLESKANLNCSSLCLSLGLLS